MLTVPVLPLNVAPWIAAGWTVRLPATFIVLLFIVNVPPVTITAVGARMLPALLVQLPPDEISMLPPSVVLVPETATADAVETEVPPLGAVLPVIVMAPVVPSNSRLLPAT